jgi:hypothetical protein
MGGHTRADPGCPKGQNVMKRVKRIVIWAAMVLAGLVGLDLGIPFEEMVDKWFSRDREDPEDPPHEPN